MWQEEDTLNRVVGDWVRRVYKNQFSQDPRRGGVGKNRRVRGSNGRAGIDLAVPCTTLAGLKDEFK